MFNSEITATGSINFGSNIAREDSSSNEIYSESEFIYDSVDDTLFSNQQLIEQLDELWTLYKNKGDEIDLIPFDDNDFPCYVDIDNVNSNQDGTSWNNAYDNLQNCLNKLALDGGEIWVKSGIYVPTTIPSIKQSAGLRRSIDRSFQMYSNIRMYGGFNGDETSRDQRDFDNHPTRLSGDLGTDGLVNNILIAADDVLIDGFIFESAGCDNITESNAGTGIQAINADITILNSIFYKLCASSVGMSHFVYISLSILVSLC